MDDNSDGNFKVIPEMDYFDLVENLDVLIGIFKKNKPNDRSDVDRVFAITITDLEKVFAYFSTFGYFDVSEKEE